MTTTTRVGLKKYPMKMSTIIFMIFCLCAAGAYGIEDMIPDAGPGLTLVMLMVLPFVWSAPMGLVAAELGSALPQEGGFYRWVQRGLGEFWGFQAGWWRTMSVYIDNTIYVVLAGSYFASVVDLTPLEEYAFKASVIVFFTYINIRGIQDVGRVSSALSLIVIAAFAMVAVVGFANWQSNPFEPFTPPGQSLWQSIGAAMAIGVWVYSGYESMSTMAGELKDPQVIPKATLISVPLIMAVYILPTMGGLASIGDWQNWSSDGGLSYSNVVSDVVPALGLGFVIVAVLAQFSLFSTYLASGSRGFFAIADDKLAPPFLVKCSDDRGVPYISVLLMAGTSLVLCAFPFEVIVVVDVMLFISAYILIFVAACVLRVKEPKLARPFKVPLKTVGFVAMCVPPVLIAFSVFFISGIDYFVGGLLALLSGPIAYTIFKRKYGGLARRDPVKYALNPITKLAVGDTTRMATLLGVMTVVGLIGMFFLPLYDDPQYFAEAYGIDNLFDLLMSAVYWITAILGILTLGLLLLAKRLEPALISARA